ncbi:DUF4360 domain-containing protein [Actinocrispum sp. NPDC049592]|uniref:DUF4360 domain-containing protein n=1 Tax=Actinocrispum sp. NPDC049592 TaxID=3154835 RepID=UPI0034263CB3
MFAAAVLVLSLVVPPPPSVTIDVLSVSGEGCPPGSASVAMSLDNEAFTVVYNDFIVHPHGPDGHKTCDISLRVNHPDGYTYGIAQTDYRGFASLEPGTKGTLRTSYFFPGLTPTVHNPHNFDGPMVGDWQTTDQPVTVVHNTCKEHKPLTIKADLKVTGKSAASMMTMDSTDGSATFKLDWRKC